MSPPLISSLTVCSQTLSLWLKLSIGDSFGESIVCLGESIDCLCKTINCCHRDGKGALVAVLAAMYASAMLVLQSEEVQRGRCVEVWTLVFAASTSFLSSCQRAAARSNDLPLTFRATALK